MRIIMVYSFLIGNAGFIWSTVWFRVQGWFKGV